MEPDWLGSKLLAMLHLHKFRNRSASFHPFLSSDEANFLEAPPGFFVRSSDPALSQRTGVPSDVRIPRPPIGFIRGTKWKSCFYAISLDG